MLTLAGFGLLAVLVAGALFLLAAYLLPAGEQIAPPIRDEPIWSLPPERYLTPNDVAVVRLPVALRGYRFAETDLLLDRLADELRARDAEIARLRGIGGVPDEPPTTEHPHGRADEHPHGRADEHPPGRADEHPPGRADEHPPARADEHPPARADEHPPARATEHPPGRADEHPPARADEHPPARADEHPPARADEH